MKLKKGTLLFLLLTCLAYTALAQTDYELQGSDVTINENGIITACSYDFNANKATGGTNLTIPKSVTKDSEIIIKGIGDEAFKEKSLVAVVFEEGSEVTAIGASAFRQNQITALTLPTTLASIGGHAFRTNQITELSLPSTLTTIESWAFQNNQITTLTFPDDAQLTTIGGYAFLQNKITTLDLPEGLTTIEFSAFENNQITELSLPTTLITIGEWAFYQNQITEPTLPTALTTIGEYAFRDNRITSLTFPENAQLTTIGKEAFLGNEDDGGNQITELTLPTALTTIGESAFGNNKITTLTFPENAQLTTIGKEAFLGNEGDGGNKITTLSLPPSLTVIGDSAFYNNSLTSVTFNDNPNKSNIQSIGNNVFSGNTGLMSITLPEHAEGADVTYKDSNDQEYNQGDSFTNFDRSLAIEIPPSYTLQAGDVTVDGQGIITECHCEKFVSKRIIIPEKIGTETITGIDDTSPGVFQDKNLISVKFADNSKVTTIGSAAFRDNPIVTLGLPASLKTIEKNAFKGNVITELILPTTLITIESSAFENNQITELSLPTALTTISEKAFYGNKITELTLPASLTTIGITAFRNNQITELTFPEDSQLASIGDDAFTFNQITELTFPISLTTIGITAFSSNQITELTFPENSQLASIGERAFSGNPLPSFTLPSVTIEGYRTYWQDGDSKDLGTNLTITDFGKSFKLVSIEQVTLTVEVNDKEGGSIEPSDDHFAIDKADAPSTQKLTAEPNTGWRFDKWIITGGEDENGNPITVTVDDVDYVEVTADADKTATAYFVKLVTLTTSVEGQQGGTISATPNHSLEDNQYDINTKVTLTATPNDGWRFDKWIITSGEDGNGNSITETVDVVGVEVTADADKTATAHFVKLVILTTAVAEQQGGTIARSVEPNNDKGVYDINTKVTLTATSNTGWKFDKWVITSGEDGNGNPITETVDVVEVTVDADKTATAHFVEAVTLTLTIEETGASNVVSGLSAGKNKIDKGADFKLKAMPASGQRFVSWTINGKTITNEEYTLPATDTEDDISITVTFEAIPQQVTLTLNIVGEGSTTPDKGESIYEKGKGVELTATPNEGWRFDKWEISDEENKTENPTTITLDKNKTVTAHFVKEEEEEEAITSILTEVVSAAPYPNPVTSQITLKAKDGDLIQLFSQKGKQQYSTQHTGNEVHTIDVSTMPVGVYLVRITDAEGNTTTKRIVKK